MGTVKPFELELLVVAVLLSEPALKQELLARLEESFGPPDLISPELPFTYTRYYDEEMGTPISRFFICFRDLVEPQRLAEIKLLCSRLEEGFRREGRRKANLDPGLLSLSRFVLASTKNSSRRVPLASGIYGEVTLVYERGSFRPLEWTYPDYRSPEYIAILNAIRGRRKAGR